MDDEMNVRAKLSCYVKYTSQTLTFISLSGVSNQ